jgi:hypothetical protein
MANLPPEFSFSQNNLHDFVDCPRRFELKYVLHQAWPAIRSAPVLEHERHMLRGERFHRMIQQHQLGLPAELISSQAQDDQLIEWWQSYLTQPPQNLPAQVYPEIMLQASLDGANFLAKLDLLAVQPGERLVIVDWKTGLKKPSRAAMRARLQTRLYPWMVVRAGASYQNGIAVKPEQVSMIYWFTADPAHPEIFHYSDDQFTSDQKTLAALRIQVENCLDSGFPLTTDERKCAFCNYRSLCERGVAAGSSAADENEPEIQDDSFGLDFDQIEPIAF